MLTVPTSLDPAAAPIAAYVAAMLWGLAREERAGRKPKRLLETDRATWERFRGRMGLRELARLLLEDAAVTQPEPFDVGRLLGPAQASLELIPESVLGDWMGELAALPLDGPAKPYLEAQASLLGVPGKPKLSDLPQLKSYHRALELPGTGGRIAAQIAETQSGIFFHDVFTFSAASWQDRALVGLAAASLAVVGQVRVAIDPRLDAARAGDTAFTHVFGLRPEKGGHFTEDDLRPWFSSAQITLV